MQPEVRLTEKERSVVRVVYTRKQQNRVIRKETVTRGYKKQYEATHVGYFNTKEEAEKARNKYNATELQKKKSRSHPFPDSLDWDWFDGTAVQKPNVWWPRPSGAWLYDHGYDDWDTEELLDDDFSQESIDGHTTKEFFDILFKTPRFVRYYVSNNNKKREWKIYERV